MSQKNRIMRNYLSYKDVSIYPLRKPIPDEQLRLMLDAAALAYRKPYLQALARAVISLAAFGGLTQKEMIGLHCDDVDTDTGQIHIRGKKTRSVPLPAECVNTLRAMLFLRPSEWPRENLIATGPNKPMPRSRLSDIVLRVREAAGLEEGFTLPELRRTYAIRLVAEGTPLETVRERIALTSWYYLFEYVYELPEETCPIEEERKQEVPARPLPRRPRFRSFALRM
jgi:integrase